MRALFFIIPIKKNSPLLFGSSKDVMYGLYCRTLEDQDTVHPAERVRSIERQEALIFLSANSDPLHNCLTSKQITEGVFRQVPKRLNDNCLIDTHTVAPGDR